MQVKTKVKIVSVLAILLVVLFFTYVIVQIASPPKRYEFEIQEITDSVYAYREMVVSPVPAQNYTMTTFCDKDGNMYTVKGDLEIVNNDSVAAYAVWMDYNIVNADKLVLHVPNGTVQYIGAVSTGRR